MTGMGVRTQVAQWSGQQTVLLLSVHSTAAGAAAPANGASSMDPEEQVAAQLAVLRQQGTQPEASQSDTDLLSSLLQQHQLIVVGHLRGAATKRETTLTMRQRKLSMEW